jgi:uncharacterized membrane protein
MSTAERRRTGGAGLCSDGRRAGIATVFAVVVPLVVGRILGATVPDLPWRATDLVLVLGGWNLFVIIYVALTMRTFSVHDVDEFAARMRRRRDARSVFVRRVTPGGDGPTFAIEAALVAFGVVLVLPHINAIELDDLVLIPVTISILLCSWALSVVSYALHYAQKDGDEPGLEFPGTRTHTFADYRYFSVAVATTFGATDVTITTPRMRRVVNVHTLLTFAYNTVIVAALASFLIH